MEKWKEFYNEEQIKNVQAIEKELLLEFIRICDELKLEYVLYGGTLLGYEKYRGFIPWDDDVDVALPRESNDQFVELAETIIGEQYCIQTPQKCKHSPYPYTKLRKKGTHFVEYHNRKLNIEDGIYIDIYPIDKIPDDEILRRKQFKRVRLWIKIYVCRQSRLYDKKEEGLLGKCKNLLRYVECTVPKIFPQKYCVKKIEHFMTMYNRDSCKRYAALNSPNFDNIYTDLYPLEKGEFEGINVTLPGNYRDHLKRRYGDYSELPPEEERFGHVPYRLEY